VAFVLHGFWTVLPFAGLELAALGTALYLYLLRCQTREVVSVSATAVTVEKGRYKPQARWVFPRAWARVLLERSPITWYPHRLAIVFQGQQVEIGRFLNEEERATLADELTRAICANGGTGQGRQSGQ